MPRSQHVVRPKLRVIAAVAALAATVPVVGATAEQIPDAPCASSTKIGAWQTFKAPTFLPPQGLEPPSQDILSLAVAPANTRLLAVTNGNSVQVSTDSGCAWKETLRLDQIPRNPNVTLSGQFTTIRSLYFSPSGRLLVLAEELSTNATVGRPHVIYSDSPGSSDAWRMGDSGLPPIGQPLTLKAHPKSPNVMYLSFANAKAPEGGGGVQCPPAPLPCPGASDNGTPGLLWGSTDGGATWSRRSDPNDLNGASVIRYFSIEDDDDTGRTLWVVTNNRLRKSTNGGASFSLPDGLGESKQAGFEFIAVESVNQPTKTPNPVQVLAFSSDGQMMRLERNEWIRSTIPFGTVDSVTQRRDGDIVVSTSPTSRGGVQVYRAYGYQLRDVEDPDADNGSPYKSTNGWERLTPAGLSVSTRVTASADSSASTFFLRDRRKVFRFRGTRITGEIIDATPGDADPVPPPVALFDPPRLNLPLKVGETRTIPYTLTLPEAPTPVDLFLLIDNSGSMQPLIDELKRSLNDVARSLSKGKIDLRIGVGQINVQPDRDELPIDNPQTDYDESKPRPVYQLLRKIGPVDRQLFRQMSTIDGRGGSGSEAQLEALYQAATGDGYDAFGVGPLVGYNVPRGQDAGWRLDKDALRIIVHATDEPFSDNIRNGHNTPGPVADALNNLKIKQIGLSQGVEDAHEDLQEMARLTNAVAPAGGTDCDANGKIDGNDPRAGEPLVCEQNFGLDRTLVNLINALQDPQDLSVQVTKSAVLRKVEPVTQWRINAKIPTKKQFSLTFSCVGLADEAFTHTLTAGLRGIKVGEETATVTCGNPPPGTPPRQPGEQPEGSTPNQPPPAPAQPAPAPIAPVQPIPQPQTQVNAQSQVNPQTGAAKQKQHQLQVALAENDIGIQDDDQLAMVGLSAEERAIAPATAVVIAGMAMASACAGAFAYRRRTQVAKATFR